MVAAAIVRDGAVLAARRRAPELGWEFPGGKLEPGEDEPAALRRECAEELGVEVRAVRTLGVSADDQIHITLWLAEVERGEPEAGPEHDAVAWLSAEDLDGPAIDGVSWLPLDVPLAAAVGEMLRRR